MMLQLLNSEDELIQLEALNFGIALLFGGNNLVQQTILDHFTETADAEWFHQFRRLIRRLTESVKSLYERQAVLVGQDEESKRQAKELRFKCEMLERCFRFLQLLCEGHFSGLQHFLRAQASNPKSYDLVTETVEILEVLERCIDDNTIGVMSQLWISLTEYIQGPCTENQHVLISTKLCESANFLLEDDLLQVTNASARIELKEEVLLTLLSIMEGQSSPQVCMHLLRTLDFHVLRRNLVKEWSAVRGDSRGASALPSSVALATPSKQNGEQVAVPVVAEAEVSGVEMSTLGFRYFALLVTLRDFEQDNRISPIMTLVDTVPAFAQMQQLVGRIEILRQERMERVYFPIPEICKSIPERDKKHILWSVERSTQQQKIESFFKLSNNVISELKHLEEVRKEPVFSMLNEQQGLLQSVSFVLAMIINLVIVFGYHAPRGSVDAALSVALWVSVLLFVLGLVQVMLAVLLLISVLLGSWKLLVIRGWELEGVASLDWSEILADRHKLLKSVGFVFLDSRVLYRSVYLFFGVLGLIVPDGYFFFAVHLFDMVVRNDILKSVMRSIGFNWKQLVMTASFTSIVVYCYSIIGFLFFRKAFFINEETLDCETMLQCTVMMLYKGLRNGGGIGDVLAPPVWEEPRTILRILYDTSFWIICILILLNSFLGIIIDTFGELRSKDQAIIEDIESKCFICGVDRHRFDRFTAGFDLHIKHDHNMWHYLYFNVHLRRTEETEYTGPESFVNQMLADQDLSFIPNQRAICLESQTNKDKGNTTQLSLDLEMLRGQSDESMQSMEQRFGKLQDQFHERLMMFNEATLSKISEVIVGQNKAMESKLSSFEARLTKMELVLQKALSSAVPAAAPVPTPRSGSVVVSSGERSLSKSGATEAKLSASAKPAAEVLNKYTQKTPVLSDSSDSDSALEVLRRNKPAKTSPPKASEKVASASGAPSADLMNKYASKGKAASESDSEDSALAALSKSKKKKSRL
jgi:inositol 1,4,5-triphosphate receptor type 1